MYGVRTIYSTNHRKELLTTMKLICSKSNLLHGVNIVSKAVPTRTTMAILECILIDASANEIKLTANDMELGIETKIEGEIAERGVIALDAKIFSEIVRKLPDSDVVIETDASFKTGRIALPIVFSRSCFPDACGYPACAATGRGGVC